MVEQLNFYEKSWIVRRHESESSRITTIREYENGYDSDNELTFDSDNDSNVDGCNRNG